MSDFDACTHVVRLSDHRGRVVYNNDKILGEVFVYPGSPSELTLSALRSILLMFRNIYN